MDMKDLSQQPELADLEAKLGSTQKNILASLREHGAWTDSQRPSWVWSTVGGTRKAMISLVRRGLVHVEKGGGTFMGQPVDVYYPLNRVTRV